jgi:ferredoxin-NADP reductase
VGVPRLFVATGTGIAPFLSALRFQPKLKDVRVLWGLREALEVPECLADVETERWVSRQEVAGTKRGRLTEHIDALCFAPDAHVYLCGLDAMIEEVSGALSERGVPADRIHREVFFTQNED